MAIDGAASSVQDVTATVMAHGLAHHFVLIPCVHVAALTEFASWTGMAPLPRRPCRDHLDARDFT